MTQSILPASALYLKYQRTNEVAKGYVSNMEKQAGEKTHKQPT